MGNRLFVGNISFRATPDMIRSEFATFGEVSDVHLPMDRETGRMRGFAFVTMATDAAAQAAIAGMNGKSIEGRPLVVNEARPAPAGDRPPRGQRLADGARRAQRAEPRARPLIAQRMAAAAGDAVRGPNGAIVCRSSLANPGNGCVPYNLFGLGVNGKAALDYITGTDRRTERFEQTVAAASLRGAPWLLTSPRYFGSQPSRDPW